MEYLVRQLLKGAVASVCLEWFDAASRLVSGDPLSAHSGGGSTAAYSDVALGEAKCQWKEIEQKGPGEQGRSRRVRGRDE